MTESSRSTSSTAVLPLVALTTLFFMWGFLTAMNDILIPFLQNAFELKVWESMLVQFAFFGAYFLGSLAYFILSGIIGDPINKIGYKNGILIGLGISAVGAFGFLLAAVVVAYPLFLGSLFILGLGFTLLQISANPYVTILGPEESASSRLNLSQGFNSLGTTLAPLIGGYLVFRVFGGSEAGKPDAVIIPYLIFGIVLLLLLGFFALAKLPEYKNETTTVQGLQALKYPHVLLGMAAIFFYVGSEVSIGSILIQYLKNPEMKGFSEETASVYVAFFWGGLMVGRFMGAISMSRLQNLWKILLMLLSGIGCFVLIWVSAWLKDDAFTLSRVWPFLAMIPLSFLAFFAARSRPGFAVGLFAVIAAILVGLTMYTSGDLAMWAIISVGLFLSIMWSNIFSLSIEKLGPLKSSASSLLVMMILGGAILPVLQGGIVDAFGVEENDLGGISESPSLQLEAIKTSFLVPLVGLIYLAFYGFAGHKTGKHKIQLSKQ